MYVLSEVISRVERLRERRRRWGDDDDDDDVVVVVVVVVDDVTNYSTTVCSIDVALCSLRHLPSSIAICNYLRDSSTHLLNGYFAASSSSFFFFLFFLFNFFHQHKCNEWTGPNILLRTLNSHCTKFVVQATKLLQQFGLLGSSWVWDHSVVVSFLGIFCL